MFLSSCKVTQNYAYRVYKISFLYIIPIRFCHSSIFDRCDFYIPNGAINASFICSILYSPFGIDSKVMISNLESLFIL